MRISYIKILLYIPLLFTPLSIHSVSAVDDVVAHFGVSAICGAGSETYFHYKTELKNPNRIFISSVLGSVPGLTKEIIDSTQEDNYFSGSDLAADIAGAFAGAFVSSLFNNVIQVKIHGRKEEGVRVSVTYNF